MQSKHNGLTTAIRKSGTRMLRLLVSRRAVVRMKLILAFRLVRTLVCRRRRVLTS